MTRKTASVTGHKGREVMNRKTLGLKNDYLSFAHRITPTLPYHVFASYGLILTIRYLFLDQGYEVYVQTNYLRRGL